MRNFLSKFVFLMIAVMSFASCSDVDDKDTVNPKIEDLTILNDVVRLGDSLRITATFSDNEQLSNYKMVIEANFERENKAFALFTFMKTAGFSTDDFKQEAEKGKITKYQSIFIREEIIPEDEELRLPIATGEYILSIYCIDSAGNEASVSKTFTLVAAE